MSKKKLDEFLARGGAGAPRNKGGRPPKKLAELDPTQPAYVFRDGVGGGTMEKVDLQTQTLNLDFGPEIDNSSYDEETRAILEKLEAAYRDAMINGNHNAAVQALEKSAKVRGMMDIRRLAQQTADPFDGLSEAEVFDKLTDMIAAEEGEEIAAFAAERLKIFHDELDARREAIEARIKAENDARAAEMQAAHLANLAKQRLEAPTRQMSPTDKSGKLI